MLKEVIIETIEEKKVIKEAFSEKKLEKVATLLASLASKKLGKGKFVPFLGTWYKDEFVSNGKKGVGYKFLSKNGAMIRFGFIQPDTKAKKIKEKFVVNRVDYWEPDGEAKFDKPSKTVILEPWINIVEVVNEIFDALLGKQVESLKENLNLKVPKKLIIYAQEVGGLSDDELMELKTWTKIVNKLKEIGVWDEEKYRGFKVTNGVKESNNTIKDLNNVEKIVPKYADPKIVFTDIEKLTKLLATNILKQNGFIITGAPGMGKTYGMEKTLKELFGEFNTPDSKVKYLKGGNISTFGLYKFLYQNRDDKIIVLDDSDALLRDKAVVNMLKSAMDSYPVRELSWESNLVMPVSGLSQEEKEEYFAKLDAAFQDPSQASKIGGKIKLPASFPFTSKIFFISNMSQAEWQKDAHLKAIWSRSVHVDVNLSREGIKERILSIIDNIEPEVPRDLKIELLEKMYESGNPLNIRVFAAAVQMKGAAYKGEVDISDDEAERYATQYMS